MKSASQAHPKKPAAAGPRKPSMAPSSNPARKIAGAKPQGNMGGNNR